MKYQSCQEVQLKSSKLKRTTKPWEKSLICQGLTIRQEGGPIWKKVSHIYDAKVAKSQFTTEATIDKEVLSRGLTS